MATLGNMATAPSSGWASCLLVPMCQHPLHPIAQGWANFLTRGPQWVLKLDRRAGTKAWRECLCGRCHVNTAAGEGAEKRAGEASALSALWAGYDSQRGRIWPIRLFYSARGAERAEGSLALPSAPSPAAVLTWQRSHKHSIHAFVPALRSSLRTHCGPRVKKFAHPC